MIAVADTSVLVDHLRGVHEALEALRDLHEIRLSALTVAELHQIAAQVGAESVDGRAAEAKLRALLEGCTVVPVDAELAALGGRIATATGLPSWDAVVLATARRSGVRLLSRHMGYGVDAAEVVVPYDVEFTGRPLESTRPP